MKTKAHEGLIAGIVLAGIVLGCSLALGSSKNEPTLSFIFNRADVDQPGLVELRWGGESEQRYPEIVINGCVVVRIRSAAGGYSQWQRGELVLGRLKQALDADVDTSEILPGFENGQAVIRAGPRLLVTADQNSAKANNTSAPNLAVVWANNIRTSLGERPLEAVTAWETATRGGAVMARASWYGSRFHGRPTASGEIFDQNVYTAAHRTLPFGTLVLVNNPATQKSVLVRINDRGPFIQGRHIDLSLAAARAIGMEESGVADIQMTIVGP